MPAAAKVLLHRRAAGRARLVDGGRPVRARGRDRVGDGRLVELPAHGVAGDDRDARRLPRGHAAGVDRIDRNGVGGRRGGSGHEAHRAGSDQRKSRGPNGAHRPSPLVPACGEALPQATPPNRLLPRQTRTRCSGCQWQPTAVRAAASADGLGAMSGRPRGASTPRKPSGLLVRSNSAFRAPEERSRYWARSTPNTPTCATGSGARRRLPHRRRGRARTRASGGARERIMLSRSRGGWSVDRDNRRQRSTAG